VHERIGQVARVEDSEEDLRSTIRQLLSFALEKKRASSDDAARLTPELGSIIPESPRRAYDVRRVIRLLADRDCEPLILWPNYGKALVCAFARMGGNSVAVLASQSLHRGGVMDAETARKGMKFIDQAQRLRIPLVFLIDVPGFIVGSEPEQQGLLSASMDYLRALASADVPKIALVLRKANGFGYFALGGPGWGGDYTAALPSAKIAFMGPEAGISLIYQRKLDQIADPDEREREREKLNAEWNARAEPWEAAHAASLDDVVQPAEARRTLVRVIEALARP